MECSKSSKSFPNKNTPIYIPDTWKMYLNTETMLKCFEDVLVNIMNVRLND